MISRNKITISFISYADKDETKKAIKDKIIPKLYDYIWNVGSKIDIEIKELGILMLLVKDGDTT